ncbi:MAG: hypothetical protein CMJ18_16180, partial [Phycisphaeraceae bacterium]|nr:hypothetical protein [Phycisphaeraceae bacterium]
YLGPGDFNFVGAYLGSGQWGVGHYNGSDWSVQASVADASLASEVDYALRVRVEDDTVTLIVDGETMLTHTFASPVTAGRVGYGTHNAAAAFDDLAIEVPPSLPYFEDFADGQADFLTPVSGAWSIDGATRYVSTPAVGEDGVSVLTLSEALPATFAIDTLMHGLDGGAGYSKNAAVIFDYQGPTDFKFAGGFFGAGQWQIGHHDGTSWVVDASFAEPLQLRQDYLAQLVIRDGAAALTVDGVLKVSHDFGAPLSDGRVGLGTRSAVAGFNALAVRDIAALPYFDDLSDGRAEFQVPLAGAWQVNEFDRYLVTPGAAVDTVSLVSLADPVPEAFRLGGVLRPKEGGGSTNAALVFDYRSPTDFKFAAAFVGLGQWWIGHHDGNGWVADVQLDATLAAETDYRADVFASGSDVSLVVDGASVLNHTFGDPLNDGAVGYGTTQSVAVFDDLTVEAGPTLPHTEDFEDGLADFFFASDGWSVTGAGRYEARSAPGADAVSLLGLAESLPARFDLAATVRGLNGAPSRNGLLIFDYHGPTDFAYAGGFFGAGLWRMGRYDGTIWSVEASLNETLATNQDYALTLSIRDALAKLSVDGATKLSHDFGTDLSGGRAGLATNNAFAEFDDVSVAENADDVGPRVIEVYVGGTSWSSAFADALASSGTGGANGFRVSTGPDQLLAVPWMNVDQVSMRFDEAVTVGAGDLSIVDATGARGIAGMSWDATTNVATWTLDGALPSNHVQIGLSDVVTDTVGNALDGEWVDEQSTTSGDGASGGALSMALHVQVGSSDRDDATSIYDVAVVRGATGGDVFADLNGDGDVTSADFDGILANQGRSLAPVSSGASGSTTVSLGGVDRLITTPSGTAHSGSADIVLSTGDGSPVDLYDYSVRVGLTGPTGVTITGGGEALWSAATTGPNPPGLLNTGGLVDGAPPTYYLGTANFGGQVLSVADGSGLIRVDYDVAPGTLGTFTFDIIVNGPADTAIVAADESIVALSVQSPTLTVTIPGDATGDFVVGTSDLNAVLANFTRNVSPGDFSSGDLTGDGVVGTEDLNLVLANFTNSVEPPSALGGASAPSRAVGAARLLRWHGWKHGASDDDHGQADQSAASWSPSESAITSRAAI